MKKIAFIVYDLSFLGGVEKVTESLANDLSKTYEVYVFCLNCSQGKKAYNFDKSVKYEEILTLKEPRLRTVIINSRKKTRKLLRDNKIDVVFEMGTYPGFITTLNTFGIKSKFVFCDHGALINQINEKDVTFMRRITSIFCKHIVVLTDRTLNDYNEKFKIRKKKMTRIYNYIDEKIFEFVKPYSNDSNLIISVGRLGNEKGFDMLIKVAKKLKTLNQDWEWHIYGDGEKYEQIKKEIDENNLSKHVKLKGQHTNKEIYNIYNKYSFLVLPSYREGLPLVLLEAKANKLPIISFDITTGPREIIEDGVDGFLIKPYDIDQMAIKIDKLLKEPELRKNFSNNTYNNINKFKKKEIIKQWIDLIESI